MKLLAIEQDVPGTTPDDFSPLLRSEALRVWELQQAGILREIYFIKDECETLDAAQEIVETLPLVKAGLITFEILPLIPYPGLARLFEP